MEKFKVSKAFYFFFLITVNIFFAGYFKTGFCIQPEKIEEGFTMEKVISKDGTPISFMRRGSGPPLVLVHGTTADHTRWLPIIPHFEKEFTVYAVDRRGRGGSGDSEDYHLMKEADDIAAVIESIDEPAVLVGHSYGGLVSLEAALLTNNINRLIIYEAPIPTGTPLYPPGTPEKMQALIDSGKNEAALEVMLKEVVKMPDYEFEKYRQLPAYKRRIEIAPTIPRETMIELNYLFDPKKFAELKIPVLLLQGGDSPIFFKEATKILDAALPNSRILVMPGQQHIAMDTNTELFVDEVKKFLEE
jgi:pimeloyl-ACP methyl ester carboxylesterase